MAARVGITTSPDPIPLPSWWRGFLGLPEVLGLVFIALHTGWMLLSYFKPSPAYHTKSWRALVRTYATATYWLHGAAMLFIYTVFLLSIKAQHPTFQQVVVILMVALPCLLGMLQSAQSALLYLRYLGPYLLGCSWYISYLNGFAWAR